MFAEPAKFMLSGAAVFALLFNLRVIYLYAIEIIYYFFFEVELWTYALAFSTVAVIGLAIAYRYCKNRTEITRLSYVNYLTEEEYERMKEEMTKEALSKLQRTQKYLELKQRLEREQQEKSRLSPPMSEDEQEEAVDEDTD